MSPSIISYGNYTGIYGWAPEVRHEDIMNFGQYLHHFITSGETYPGEVWSGTVNISGDMTVPVGLTLTVQSDATIIFAANSDDQSGGFNQNNCELIVNGRLDADGGTFTSSGSGHSQWYGIVFDNANINSYIINSTIEEAGNGIRCLNCNDDVPLIEKNTIKNNYVGIKCESSSPYIYDNYIIDNSLYGIYCIYDSHPYIRHNQMQGNVAGLCCMNSSSPQLIGKNTSEPHGANDIINNSSHGLRAYNSSNPNLGIIGIPSKWSAGQNNIYGNTNYLIFNNSSQTIYARCNWWGVPNPPSQLFHGSVVYNYALILPMIMEDQHGV